MRLAEARGVDPHPTRVWSSGARHDCSLAGWTYLWSRVRSSSIFGVEMLTAPL
jgi:hypothetical protein